MNEFYRLNQTIIQKNVVLKAGSRLLFNCLTPAQWRATYPQECKGE